MIDEREAHDVRTWLSSAEVPSLRLDVLDTVRTGRRKVRQRRNRRIAGGAAFVVAAVLAVPGTVQLLNAGGTGAPPAAAKRTPPPVGPFSCTYRALPVPPGLGAGNWSVQPDGMDPSGRYVVAQAMGAVDQIDGPRIPVLWDNGVGRVISPKLRGRPTAVSETGIVAGERMPGGGTWIYRDGTVSDLPVPAGATGSRIVAVDADGDLLGTVYTTGPNTMRVAVWKAGDLGNPRYLDAPGEIVTPIGFLGGGGVAGWSDPERIPYVWSADGRGSAYAKPAGALDYRPVGVGGGYLYGVGKKAVAEDMVPIRWRIGGDGTAEWLSSPAAPGASLEAVGRGGGLLVQLTDGTSVVVRGEHRAPVPAPAGQEARAAAIDEFGTTVAGSVTSSGGTGTPAIWTC